MNWLWLVSYFFGGVFAANAIPHFVAGTMGRPFQSPFAKPPGKGLSSSTVNVVWGFFNAVVGYLLVAHVGAFDPRATSHILAFGLGALLISIFSCASLRPVPWGQHASRVHEESSVRHLSLPEKLQLPLVDSSALWFPTSVPGCSASLRTGWC